MIAMVTLSMIVIGMTSAHADHPDSSGFSIDGDVPDPGAVQFADGFGNQKELGPENGSTTKLGVIHTDPLPTLAETNPNGQVDLRNVWFDTNSTETTDWLYFAWERDSNKGSGVIAIEFQTGAAPVACDYSGAVEDLIANCNPWANRQVGDFILIWDQVGNDIEISVRFFDGTVFGEKIVLDPHEADATLSPDNTRGEAVIDLAVVFGNGEECVSIANVIPGTLTGNSDTADYKDTVLADIADAITISNCGSVQVTKVDDAGTALEGVTFALYTDDGDDDFDDESPATGFQGEALECTTSAAGTCTIVDVPFDDYWINETNLDDANYEADPDLPEKVQVTTTTTVTLSYVNPRLRGSIQVEKLVAGTTDRLDGATFALDADGDPTTTGDQTAIPGVSGEKGLFCIDDLLFADYNVVEVSPPSGYTGDSSVEVVSVGTKSTCADRASDSVDASFSNQAITAIVTAAETPVTVGDTITDTATLSGGYNPTGTITFTAYSDAACTTEVFSDTVAVDMGNGDYTSGAYTTTAAGSIYWIASYSGDDSNTSAAGECGDDGETSVVDKEDPAIVTQASGPVTVGDTVNDTATLSGGFAPTGSITFYAFDSLAACQADEGDADGLSGDGAVFTDTVSVDGNGPYVSGDYTTTAAVDIYWVASYSGDGNNLPASGACGDENETSVVDKAQPDLDTTPRLLPNDTATLSGGFETLDGSLTFELHDSVDCSGDALYEETVDVSGAGDYGTSNTDVFITADGTYSWLVSYTGDGDNEPATSACDAERYVVDITPDP